MLTTVKSVKMPCVNCCVQNCKNNTNGPLRFFSFPKDDERRQLWAESCGRRNWYPNDRSRICEAHFDKTEFEQNQTDKPLRWSAIPRMYEEWTKDISSSLEDLKDYIDEEIPFNPGNETDATESQDDEVKSPTTEESPKDELKKSVKRKRVASENERDSSEDRGINASKRGRKKMCALEQTEELEDEFSRIKSSIKHLLEEPDAARRGYMRSREAVNAELTPTKNPSASPRETSSQSEEARRRSLQELKRKANLLYKEITNDETDDTEQSSEDTQHVARAPSSQLQRKQNHSRKMYNPKQRMTRGQTAKLTSLRRDALLQEILGNTEPDPNKESSEKPWRPPDISKVVDDAVIACVPDEKGLLTRIVHPKKDLVTHKTIRRRPVIRNNKTFASSDHENSGTLTGMMGVEHFEDEGESGDESASTNTSNNVIKNKLRKAGVKSKNPMQEDESPILIRVQTVGSLKKMAKNKNSLGMNKNAQRIRANNVEEVSETQTSVRNTDESANPPESKSAKLKKLLASVLAIEEEIFSKEFDTENQKENPVERTEAEVQVDIINQDEITKLEAKVAKLSQQLEEKDRVISHLHQSLAAVIPPGHMVMLEGDDNEKYMVFNNPDENPS